MTKGKLGILLPFYAILAFLFVCLNQLLPLIILLGFVLIVEKDEWVSKQVMQALFLELFVVAVATVFGGFNVFDSLKIVYSIIGGVNAWINRVAYIVVLVFSIIGIVKNAGGKDAGIPIFSKLADKIFGHFTPKPVANYAPNGQYQQNPNPNQYQANPNHYQANPNQYQANPNQYQANPNPNQYQADPNQQYQYQANPTQQNPNQNDANK